MQFRDNKTFTSFFAGILLLFGAPKKPKADIRKELAKDLSTGFSRRSIRFNKGVRDKFRNHWLKVVDGD